MTPEKAYLAALGVSRKPRRRRKQLRAALARAHHLRHFEIENYWRRATYAWAFQAAALVALGFALDKNADLTGAATALGALAALAATLTARGSRFWQRNWEAHVDLLETAFEGRLMQTVIDRQNSWSVSRVNERFLGLLTIGWTAGFLASVLALGQDRLALGQAAGELVGFAAAAGLLFEARTELKGWRRPFGEATIVLRETVAGEARDPWRKDRGEANPTARTG